VQEELQVPQNSNVVRDQIICFPGWAGGRGASAVPAGRDLGRGETGSHRVPLEPAGLRATTIAAIYKERWQVELFFKALKQTLKIKTFVGPAPTRFGPRCGRR